MTLEAVLLAAVAWVLLSRRSARPHGVLPRYAGVSAGVVLLSLLALATWRSVLGVVTLDIMLVIGATVIY